MAGRKARFRNLIYLLGPAFALVLLLFGGGLTLGLFQALGYSAAEGVQSITFDHFRTIFTDPDFGGSITLTLYISLTSTLLAASISIVLALAMISWAAESRLVNFILEIPLTVPHLVVAISILLLLSPAGLFSRLLSFLGLLSSSSSFPLLINDDYGIGIIMVYVWKEVPFITFMLLSVLTNLGPELNEAGATLRASRFQRFRYITLPILGPSLGAACLIVFAFTFGAFEVPYLLGKTYPISLPVWAYKNYSDIDLLARPEGIAIGLIIAAIITLSITLAQLLMHFARRRGVIV
jgi:putative spermidine/putrescine transport system permease protein